MTSKNIDHIQTTHVGSLPRTQKLLDLNKAHQDGSIAWDDFVSQLHDEVRDVVKRQIDLGIDIVNDGEYGHVMTQSVDYGGWWNYSFSRLSGLTAGDSDSRWGAEEPLIESKPGQIRLASFAHRRDRALFKDAYENPVNGVLAARNPVKQPSITGEITYTGADAVKADTDGLRTALDELNAHNEGFVAALSPGSAARLTNEFYDSDEDVVWACAEALKNEYKAIVDAGFVVQIDDPSIAESWDQIVPEPSVADYQKFIQIRIDALNHALEGLPEDKVRFHLCWGSWHGPHTTDLEFKYLVDQMLTINAGSYSFEAGNVRHAHEWEIWEDTKLPEGKLIVPGVVSHSTNVVEHPELVAQRIEHFAGLVGRENVIASTDCGFGGRIHPDIAWAKLESLTAGAKLASQRLF